MKKYNMFFSITITLEILAFSSATQTAIALESAPTRYQKGYNDVCAGITVPAVLEDVLSSLFTSI